MNPKRAQILALLDEARDYPPTLREVATAIAGSKSGTRYHLTILREQGLVVWEPLSPRTLMITREGREALRGAQSTNGVETPS